MKSAAAIIFFCFSLFLISCQKELSFESSKGANTATAFTLGGAGSNCTGATLSGVYMNAQVMTSANTVQLQVQVTVKGAYSISTNTVNGVSFSGTGNFADTGAHTIIMVASGTPAGEGTKTFLVSAGGSTCSFDVSFAPKAPPAVFTLQGAPNACTLPVINGVYTATVPVTASNTAVIKIDVTTAGAYNIVTNIVNGLSFSATGVFTTTGTGIPVTLIAAGTPLAAGTTTLKPAVNAANCSFDVTIAPAPVVTGIYSCKIDGVATTFTESASAGLTEALTNAPYLATEGYKDANLDSYFRIFISNNDQTAVKTGTYDEKHYVPTSATSLGYRIEVDYSVLNADLSTTIWNTSSNIPTISPNNPAFTIIVTSLTATRAKGTFSGKLTNLLQGSTAFKTITEGVFDLPIQ